MSPQPLPDNTSWRFIIRTRDGQEVSAVAEGSNVDTAMDKVMVRFKIDMSDIWSIVAHAVAYNTD